MLRLQDLNNKNIRKVCIDSLETLFKDNCVSLDGKSALVSELTKKADGVLWVHLAIKSIQRSHSNSDSLDELMIASDAAVKNHILGSLEGELAASPIFFMERCTSMINKIESSCGGFLELGPSGEMANKINPQDAAWETASVLPFTNTTIGFIHRTAVDFLKTTDSGRNILGKDPSTQGESATKFLRSALAQFVLWTRSINQPSEEHKLSSKMATLMWPQYYRYRQILSYIGGLEPEIDSTVGIQLLTLCERIWATEIAPVKCQYHPDGLSFSFLFLANRHGLYDYVVFRLSSSPPMSARDELLHDCSVPSERWFDFGAKAIQQVWNKKQRLMM